MSRTFESGSVRDADDNKPLTNHLLGYTRLRFGYRLRTGATQYGKGNWKLGQPEETIEESTDRHWAQYMDGDRSEDHLAAVMFGLNQLMLKDKEAGMPADYYFKPTIRKEEPKEENVGQKLDNSPTLEEQVTEIPQTVPHYEDNLRPL